MKRLKLTVHATAEIRETWFVDVPEHSNVCQNCDASVPDHELREIQHIQERVAPGEPMPSGECPHCGALCQELWTTGTREEYERDYCERMLAEGKADFDSDEVIGEERDREIVDIEEVEHADAA